MDGAGLLRHGFFASRIFFRGFTVFVPAVRDSLNLNQAQANLVFSLARAEGGLEGLVAGWAFDHYGNFDLALIPSIGCAVAASLCFFMVRKPPQLTKDGPAVR